MTREEFNDTPIVVGQAATTYGEMRTHAESRDAITPEGVLGAALNDPAYLASAMRGMCVSIAFLLDTIEQMLNDREEASK